MLNYEKILVIVAYRFNIKGLLELNAEAPTFVQVRPIAQTPVIVAPVALPRETFVVLMATFPMFIIQRLNLYNSIYVL